MMQATFLEDQRLLSWDIWRVLNAQARAHSVVDSMKREVMKGLCCHTWEASQDRLIVEED